MRHLHLTWACMRLLADGGAADKQREMTLEGSESSFRLAGAARQTGKMAGSLLNGIKRVQASFRSAYDHFQSWRQRRADARSSTYGVRFQALHASSRAPAYIDALLSSSAPYETYLQYRDMPQYTADLSFYLDCADVLLRLGDSHRQAGLTVLTNVVELDLFDEQLLRIAAHRLQQLALGMIFIAR